MPEQGHASTTEATQDTTSFVFVPGWENNQYYGVLEVDTNASQKEIKAAYRAKAKELHPDVSGADTAEQFKQLNEAYEVLGNSEKRFSYDTHLAIEARKAQANENTTANVKRPIYTGYHSNEGPGKHAFNDIFGNAFNPDTYTFFRETTERAKIQFQLPENIGQNPLVLNILSSVLSSEMPQEEINITALAIMVYVIQMRATIMSMTGDTIYNGTF